MDGMNSLTLPASPLVQPAYVLPPARFVRAKGWPWTHLLRMRNDPLALMRDGAKHGADVVQLDFGFTPAFVLYSPDAVHRALVPGDAVWKGTRGAKLMRRVLGPGLLTTEGVAWKARRKRAQPRFRSEALKSMPGIVQRHSDQLVERWLADPAHAGVGVDAMAGFSRLALAVVCDVLFGVDPGEDAAVVHQALEQVLSGFLRLMTSPIEGLDQWPLPASRRHRAAVAALDAVVARLIVRRRAAGPLEGDLLADWIVAADAGEMSVEDLHAEVVTMLLAGHETTANAMTFTLALLGSHPAELAAVQAGLDVGDTGPLDRAFAEGLRLYPPAWVMARATSEPLDLGPVTAPAGAFLFIPIAAIQRDPRWWRDADAFVPGRFLDLDPASKAAYMPFGLGPRKCIGEHFARAEARIALATVLRQFDVQAVVPAANPSITLRPLGAVPVRLTPRASAGGQPGRCAHKWAPTS